LTKIINSLSNPVVSPFGAKRCFRKPPTPLAWTAQMIQQRKKIIAIGERDGVPGPVIAECLEGAGMEVVFQATECFV
jgi:hypothetical protein